MHATKTNSYRLSAMINFDKSSRAITEGSIIIMTLCELCVLKVDQDWEDYYNYNKESLHLKCVASQSSFNFAVTVLSRKITDSEDLETSTSL